MKLIYEKSISLLQKAEKLALTYSDKGFYLAFSGGKDSQCLYHIAKLAGVKFEAHYIHTGIDHPELVRFIHKYYSDVKSDFPDTTFWRLVRKKKMLPTQLMRYCCAVLKETNGAGAVTLTGVRRAESTKRKKRNAFEVSNHLFSSDDEKEFEEWRKEQIAKNTNQDQFAEQGETEVRCISGKDKIIINPILNWTDKDVWYFLDNVAKVPHCALYDKGWERLGCLFCPMAKQKELHRMEREYPKYKQAYLRVIEQLRQDRILQGKKDYWEGMSAEDVFQWWVSKKELKKWKAQNKQQLFFNFTQPLTPTSTL